MTQHFPWNFLLCLCSPELLRRVIHSPDDNEEDYCTDHSANVHIYKAEKYCILIENYCHTEYIT